MDSSSTAAVLFCDVVGSTARAARLGDRVADEQRRELFELFECCVEAGGGETVKTLGDGVMAVFASTIGALECAVKMHAGAADLEPEDPLQLRIGVSIGEVLGEHGDWFGTPVVEAARLCDAAADGSTLAHAMVASLAGSRGEDFDFVAAGQRRLKGLPEPVPVVEVSGCESAGAELLVVPRPGDGSGAQHQPGAAPHHDLHSASVPAEKASHPRRVRSFLVLGALVMLVAGAGAVWVTGDDPNPPGVGNEGDLDAAPAAGVEGDSVPVGYTPVVDSFECGENISLNLPTARCGTLEVPESRAEAESSTISVYYVMVPARGEPSADPVVLVGFNEHIDRTPLSEVADVYALNVRGFDVEHHDDFDCPALRSAYEVLFAEGAWDPAGLTGASDAAAQCAEAVAASGRSLNGYNWTEVALDIRDLAVAESLGRINVVTEGYMTLAAVELARSNPALVNTLVLTNPVAPGVSPLAEAPRSAALKLDHLDVLCSADPPCAGSFGDLRRLFDTSVDRFRSAPTVVSTHSLDGEGPYEVLLDDIRMGAALATSMRASAQIGLVPASIRGASPDLLAGVGINDEMNAYVSESASAAAHLSFVCSYDAGPVRVAETISASGSYVIGAAGSPILGLCDNWPVESSYEPLSQDLPPEVPVLVAEGGFSDAAVNDWGERLTEASDSAVLLRFDTLSDDLNHDPPKCLADMRNGFIEDPLSVSGTAECERESPEIDWVTMPS